MSHGPRTKLAIQERSIEGQAIDFAQNRERELCRVEGFIGKHLNLFCTDGFDAGVCRGQLRVGLDRLGGRQGQESFCAIVLR